MHPGDLVSGVDCSCCGYRRVDAARHRGQYFHSRPLTGGNRDLAAYAKAAAAFARRTASGNAAASARISARVEEWPSENLSAERASASLQPIAISTWLGCETPAEHAAPVAQSIPAASRSIRMASAEQPGKPMLAMPGRRSSSAVGP